MAVDAVAAEKLAGPACEESHPDAGYADFDDGCAEGKRLGKGGPRDVVFQALVFGATVIVAMAGLVGWQGFQFYQRHQAEQQRNIFLQVARQAALNLTTIDYTEVEADVRRVLDSSTGSFHDEFEQRSRPFIEVVKQAQSKSDGTIAEAGLESENGNQARVLVAVNVKTSIAGNAQPEPRAWRMRITVQKAGDSAKVSGVEFVP